VKSYFKTQAGKDCSLCFNMGQSFFSQMKPLFKVTFNLFPGHEKMWKNSILPNFLPSFHLNNKILTWVLSIVYFVVFTVLYIADLSVWMMMWCNMFYVAQVGKDEGADAGAQLVRSQPCVPTTTPQRHTTR
jgi:hypothetical protein